MLLEEIYRVCNNTHHFSYSCLKLRYRLVTDFAICLLKKYEVKMSVTEDWIAIAL